jgi:hypothetical protein
MLLLNSMLLKEVSCAEAGLSGIIDDDEPPPPELPPPAPTAGGGTSSMAGEMVPECMRGPAGDEPLLTGALGTVSVEPAEPSPTWKFEANRLDGDAPAPPLELLVPLAGDEENVH